MINLTKDNFEAQISQDPALPALVLVWASWCSNCKRQWPIIEQFANESASSAHFLAVKADDEEALVRSLKIMAVPTLLLYSHGVLVKKMTGVKTVSQLTGAIAAVKEYSADEALANQHKSWISKLFKR